MYRRLRKVYRRRRVVRRVRRPAVRRRRIVRRKTMKRRRIYRKKTVPMKRVRMAGDSSDIRDAKFVSKSYKRRPSVLKIAKLGSDDVVFRYQALKNDSLISGYHNLVWGSVLGSGNDVPMHIYNLGIIPNGGVGPVAAGLQAGWASSLATSDRTVAALLGLDPTGVAAANCPWYPEINGTIDFDQVTKAMHKWTSVKMQCYGSKLEDIKYSISLVRFKDDFANLWSAAVSNQEGKELQDYMTFPFMSSRINSTAGAAGKKYLSVVKEWSITVPRLAEESATGVSSRELNIFVRHNVLNEYNWPIPATHSINAHDAIGNLGFGIDYAKHTVPQPRKTLFLVVRASCPYLVTNPDQAAQFSGTYNIVIRNAFTVPT